MTKLEKTLTKKEIKKKRKKEKMLNLPRVRNQKHTLNHIDLRVNVDSVRDLINPSFGCPFLFDAKKI